MLFNRRVASFLISSIVLSSVIVSAALHAADFAAPVVRLSLDRSGVEQGQALAVSATVTDNQQVSRVVLRYRALGSSDPFLMIPMKQSAVSKLYVTSIPASDAVAPGVEYFVEATDGMGNVSQEPFPNHPRVVSIEGGSPIASSKINWLWVAAGAVAVGVLAGSVGGGSSSDGGVGSSSGAMLTITAPTP